MNEVSLINHNSYTENLKEKIDQSLKLIDGYNFIKRQSNILIKPNFVTARPVEECVNTHPLFIKALVELFHEHGAKISIGDSPAIMKGTDVARRLGLYELLSPYNVNFIDFTEGISPYQFLKDTSNFQFKQIELAKEIFEFDHIVNAAKLKSHAQMGITLTTKNLFGCVTGHKKTQWHYHTGRDLDVFARLIIEIALLSNTSLHLLDGIWSMAGNGPTNGYKVNTNVILASKNSLSLDRVVLDILKKEPDSFPFIRAAKSMNLKDSVDISKINILGDAIENCEFDNFEIPGLKNLKFVNNKLIQNLISSFLDKKMIVNHSLCIDCKKCINQCPAKAMTFSNKVKINHSLCIRCCCCQEICPVGALSLKKSVLGRISNS